MCVHVCKSCKIAGVYEKSETCFFGPNIINIHNVCSCVYVFMCVHNMCVHVCSRCSTCRCVIGEVGKNIALTLPIFTRHEPK